MQWKITTATATDYNINRSVRYADAVIGAVLLKGEKAPHIVTEEMVKEMKAGSVIVDVSIDQGGCVETSRPTTLSDPVFIRHGVVHYCVPNMTATVGRTATAALTNAMVPYLLETANSGIEKSFLTNPGLAKGVCTFGGHCTNSAVARIFDLEQANLLVPALEPPQNGIRRMNWLEQYKSKVVSLQEAVSAVKSEDRIFVSGNAATPLLLMRALAERKQDLLHVEVNHLLLIGDDPLSKPGMEKHFRHNSLFVGPVYRAAIADGSVDSVSVRSFQIPALFRQGIIPLDVAIIHFSPPDEHGFMSLGVECAGTKAAVESAKIVVAQVNEKMPRTLGDVFVHVSHVDKIVECSEDLETLPHGSGYSDVEMKIGSHIAALIEDGSTLQLGIGGIPDAVLSNLEGKNNLGVHTEMVSDGVVRAIEKESSPIRKKRFIPAK